MQKQITVTCKQSAAQVCRWRTQHHRAKLPCIPGQGMGWGRLEAGQTCTGNITLSSLLHVPSLCKNMRQTAAGSELAGNINLSVIVHAPAHCRTMWNVKAQNRHLEGWKVIRLTWGTAITLEAHLLEEDIPHVLAHAHCAPMSLRAGFDLLSGGNKSSQMLQIYDRAECMRWPDRLLLGEKSEAEQGSYAKCKLTIAAGGTQGRELEGHRGIRKERMRKITSWSFTYGCTQSQSSRGFPTYLR